MKKKLFLLDAFALIYRAYFAFGNNHRYNSKGLNTSAILGFTNSLIEVLTKEKPTHIGIAFDSPTITLRQETFADYKAQREEMPEDIKTAIPYIKEIIEAFNIPILLKEGYEADDIIGTLAKKAEKKHFKVFMMTPDKDFAQLVSENIFIYKPSRGGKPPEIWGVKEVQQRFGITRPEQVIDILALWGDAADNIPGVPGIGEKTAIKLISKYGSIENLFEHIDELKGKLKENIEQYKEQAILSKHLATIITDVPIEFHEEALTLKDYNEEKLYELFSELEFKTLAKRFLGKEIIIKNNLTPSGGQMNLFDNPQNNNQNFGNSSEVPKEINTIKDISHTYQLIKSEEEIKKLINTLQKQKEVCFDTETTGLNPLEADIVGMSFAYQPHEAYFVILPDTFDKSKQILSLFKPFFENKKIEKIGQNIKYDINVLKKYNIDVQGKIFDTMLAHYLLQPDLRHNMDYLSEVYLNYKPISLESLIGKKGKKQKSVKTIPEEILKDYACEDADITLQLKEVFEKMLEQENLSDLFFHIETPLTRVLAKMEFNGIKLDSEFLKQLSAEITQKLQEITKKIYQEAHEEFNIDSPKQLGVILFEKLQIVKKPKKTKTGQYATGEDVISKLKSKHPIIPLILDYRMLKKLKSTYVDALPKLVNPKTQRIHTTYMQTVAATGRLSSVNPNLQNIPVKTELGREIRKAFVATDENYELLAADYSQIELRIIASLAGDEHMIKAFAQGEDIHASTAAKVFGVKKEEVTRELRNKAKAVNFGIIYGQSAFGLAQTLNISRTEAKEIIDNYFRKFPKIKQYIEDVIEQARKNGYVTTIFNRKRYLKDINSQNAVVRGHAERNAINAPIQGSAADIIKKAMINIDNQLEEEKLQTKMVLQVHDELVFDVPITEKEKVKNIVKNNMENAVKLKVPLKVDMNFGKNWLEAH